MPESIPALPPEREIALLVERTLSEDVGAGDLTAGLLADAAPRQAAIIARESATFCGRAWADEVYRQLDQRVLIDWQVADGERLQPNQCIARLSGPPAALLTGERSVLNLLQTLSATATRVSRFVDAVAGTGVRILDTRKTLPGLRWAQKYAVRCGGGCNHRMGLFDAILIKENHIAAAGGVAGALRAAAAAGAGVEVEIEVETLAQLDEALEAGAKRILLDNFSPELLRQAVSKTAGRARLEASGGIGLGNVREFAETGVDDISIGELTKHLTAVDLSMRLL